MTGFIRAKVIERLTKNHKIDKNNCYVWSGNKTAQGYGSTSIFGTIYLVHRLSVMLFHDLEFDVEFNVRHKCDNRLCFNPDHLLINFK